MMLPFWDILHCSQHTLTHALAVRHFLPLLLLTITLLIHTNRTAQPIADLSPGHVHHVSFFSYPALIPMMYYTTTSYTLIPTTHASTFWVRRTTAYNQMPTYVLVTSLMLRFSVILHLSQWSTTQQQTLLQFRQHMQLDSGFEEPQHTSNHRLISYSRQSYFVFLLSSTYPNDLLHNNKLYFNSDNTCNYILDSKNHSILLHYDYIEYKHHIIQFKSTHTNSICNHALHIPVFFYTARRNARRDWIIRSNNNH